MLRVKYQTRVKLFLQGLRVKKTRAKRNAIFSVSGLIATDAKRSLKVSPGKSKPFAIPKAHTKGGLRVIRFAVRPDGKESIIGPVKFPRSNRFNAAVPSIHEFGKTVIDIRRGKIRNYPPRPYMSRTLERLNRRGEIPKQFAASVARIF
jgi:hypothetical protein